MSHPPPASFASSPLDIMLGPDASIAPQARAEGPIERRAVAAPAVENIFLTGATGVVGRRLVPLLVAQGHTVTAIGRSPAKRDALARAGARAVDVSLFDAGRLREHLTGHTTVINLATHIPASTLLMLLPWAWRENDRIRQKGSATLVSAALAAGVGRFIQESFAPMYAAHGDSWIDESHLLQPAIYNRSTLDAEASAARFTAAGGTGVILRFALFYGPDANTLREMVDTLRKGWSPMPGAAHAYLSSLSHDDAASGVAASLKLSSGVYNVSDDEPMRRSEWVEVLGILVPGGPRRAPRPLPEWLTRVGPSMLELLSRSQRISNAKFRGATSWAPRYSSVREGFRAVSAEWRHASRRDDVSS